MRKAITMSLAATLMAAAIGGSAMAADQAGIGFEFGMGPKIVLGGGFGMTMDQAGAFTWNVSDNFAVSIFSGTGTVNGSFSYTDDDTADNNGGVNVDRKVTVNGHQDTKGLAIWASLPMLTFLKVGFELGTVELNESNRDYSAKDGSTTVAGDFAYTGGADSLNGVAMMEGVAGKLTFIRGNSKTVSADLSVMGNLRFAQLEDEKYIYGHQETEHPVANLKEIDPISNFNTLDIKLVATIGF